MRRSLVLTSLAGGAVAATLAVSAAVAGASSAEPLAPQSQQTCTNCQAETRQNEGRGNGQGQGRMQQGGHQRGQAQQGQTQQGQTQQGMQQGRNRQGQTELPPSGALTAAQLADLGVMAEEEKLAHDVYVALGEATGDVRFSRIAASESRHLEAMRNLLARYDQADPTSGKAAGEFVNAEFAALYPDLVAKGSASLDAALEVGRTIERMDIADLTEALGSLTAPDVQRVYSSLLAGSQNHLRAFGG